VSIKLSLFLVFRNMKIPYSVCLKNLVFNATIIWKPSIGQYWDNIVNKLCQTLGQFYRDNSKTTTCGVMLVLCSNNLWITYGQVQSTISHYWAATFTANQFLCVVIIDEKIVVTIFGTEVSKVPQTHCKWFWMTVVTVQSVITKLTDGMPVSVKELRIWKQTPEAATLACTYKK